MLNILMLIIRLNLEQNDGKLSKNKDLRHKIRLRQQSWRPGTLVECPNAPVKCLSAQEAASLVPQRPSLAPQC